MVYAKEKKEDQKKIVKQILLNHQQIQNKLNKIIVHVDLHMIIYQ
jgi:formiminotetrahydrofolate cyclodeaminase